MTGKEDDLYRDAMVIVKSLLQIGSNLHRNGDRIAGEYGLNQQQFVVLSEIVERGPLSQKQLVGGLVIEKSNMSKIVKKLKSLGFVKTTQSPDDGRTTLLSPTPKGREVWEDCMNRFKAWQIEWISPLSESDVSQTVKVLERLKGLPL